MLLSAWNKAIVTAQPFSSQKRVSPERHVHKCKSSQVSLIRAFQNAVSLYTQHFFLKSILDVKLSPGFKRCHFARNVSPDVLFTPEIGVACSVAKEVKLISSFATLIAHNNSNLFPLSAPRRPMTWQNF